MNATDRLHGFLLVAMLAGAGAASAVSGPPVTAGPGAGRAAAPPAGAASASAPAAASSAAPAASAATPAAAWPTVDAARLAELKRTQGDRLVVLDVRRADEYAQGHVPGSINVPHDQVEARLAELGTLKGKDVVVYCRSGRRAGLALDVLQKHGFTGLHHLEGDIGAWAAAGQPMATAPAPAPAPAAKPAG